ncbi:MAG: hypothetical protein LBD23_17885, partial [Oscillospiraceae bacterium]|nr:hypothetical protein [Oscillospiraceae bacterium]
MGNDVFAFLRVNDIYRYEVPSDMYTPIFENTVISELDETTAIYQISNPTGYFENLPLIREFSLDLEIAIVNEVNRFDSSTRNTLIAIAGVDEFFEDVQNRLPRVVQGILGILFIPAPLDIGSTSVLNPANMQLRHTLLSSITGHSIRNVIGGMGGVRNGVGALRTASVANLKNMTTTQISNFVRRFGISELNSGLRMSSST